MRVAVSPTAQKAATLAARTIARKLRAAIAERGIATLALSGGSSAPPLYAELARQQLEWAKLHVFQVDERIAPACDAARNLGALERALAVPKLLPRVRLHAMPVDDDDLEQAARSYAAELEQLAGTPPVLDVVHLGLGEDGHTASLFPGDAALTAEAAVTVTGAQSGYRRMTLTLPVLNAARHVLWFVTGAAKRQSLMRLTQLKGRGWDAPAGKVARRQAVLYADRAAKEK